MAATVPMPDRHRTLITHRFETHRDVCAALGAAALTCGAAPVGRASGAATHDQTTGDYAPARLEQWRGTMDASARTLAGTLPLGDPVDLLAAFAVPWSHALALQLAGVSPDDRVPLLALARRLFLASAHAANRTAIGDTATLAGELARALPDAAAPLAVQSFVAVSQTLPHTLAGAWLVLAEQPEPWRALQGDRGLMPRAVEELLRLASPARAVFRQARRDVVIGAAHVGAGDEVILRLDAANRDARRFPDPLRADLHRAPGGQVGLGRGMHPCAGGALVRMALSIATAALLDVADTIRLAAPVTWLDGTTIRAPDSLPVVLQRAAASLPEDL